MHLTKSQITHTHREKETEIKSIKTAKKEVEWANMDGLMDGEEKQRAVINNYKRV